MKITYCTRNDFQRIVGELPAFWGSDRSAAAHHPMFVEEFSDTAFVVRDVDQVCAYLFGFFSTSPARFYIHLVAVRDTHRGNGFASALYDHIEDLCRQRGVDEIKAITAPFNKQSQSFHKARGFELLGSAEVDGIRYEPNYGGSGRQMTIMRKRLGALS